jgi:hypothetical protein
MSVDTSKQVKSEYILESTYFLVAFLGLTLFQDLFLEKVNLPLTSSTMLIYVTYQLISKFMKDHDDSNERDAGGLKAVITLIYTIGTLIMAGIYATLFGDTVGLYSALLSMIAISYIISLIIVRDEQKKARD